MSPPDSFLAPRSCEALPPVGRLWPSSHKLQKLTNVYPKIYAASKFLKLLVKGTTISIYIVINDMINDHYSRRRQDAYVALKNYTTASPSAKT